MGKGVVPQESLSMTVEARLVRMVRANLCACNNDQWVHIIEHNDYDESGFIVCELFEKQLYPKYPRRSAFLDNETYYAEVQRITYEVSHEDIRNQKLAGVKGRVYRLNGRFLYDEFGISAIKCYKVSFLGIGEKAYWDKKWQIREERITQREVQRAIEDERIYQEQIRLRRLKRQEALSKDCCVKCKYYRKDSMFPQSGYCQNKEKSGSSYVSDCHIPKKDCFEKCELR